MYFSWLLPANLMKLYLFLCNFRLINSSINQYKIVGIYQKDAFLAVFCVLGRHESLVHGQLSVAAMRLLLNPVISAVWTSITMLRMSLTVLCYPYWLTIAMNQCLVWTFKASVVFCSRSDWKYWGDEGSPYTGIKPRYGLNIDDISDLYMWA